MSWGCSLLRRLPSLGMPGSTPDVCFQFQSSWWIFQNHCLTTPLMDTVLRGGWTTTDSWLLCKDRAQSTLDPVSLGTQKSRLLHHPTASRSILSVAQSIPTFCPPPPLLPWPTDLHFVTKTLSTLHLFPEISCPSHAGNASWLSPEDAASAGAPWAVWAGLSLSPAGSVPLPSEGLCSSLTLPPLRSMALDFTRPATLVCCHWLLYLQSLSSLVEESRMWFTFLLCCHPSCFLMISDCDSPPNSVYHFVPLISKLTPRPPSPRPLPWPCTPLLLITAHLPKGFSLPLPDHHFSF